MPVAEPITIPKIATDQDTDFEALYAEGISLLQKFSGDVWTDYNEHDPGVTILESLCYVLTDLYSRTEIPIQDLLASKTGEVSYEKAAMFSAADILLNSATTPNDYRKIIADQIAEVNNVWVNPLYATGEAGQPIGIAGLYEVLVDLNVNKTANEFLGDNSNDTIAEITEEINDLLTGNRKMSEVFSKITILQQVQTSVFFNLYVKESADAEQVLAEILFNIMHFLKPGIDFYSYDELAANGYSTDMIFEGPKLQNGFIPDSELGDKVPVLYVDSLLKLIVQTKEVASADSLTLLIGNMTSPAAWPIPKDQSLTLDLMKSLRGIVQPDGSVNGGINIYKKGVLFPYNKNHVISLFRDLESKKRKNRNLKLSDPMDDIQPPRGHYRDPAAYYSMQHDFPKVYGIGSNKLPGSTKNSRKAQALQLKSYLLFYEQLFADFMMQTANLGQLFSTGQQGRTYFYQPLYSVPDAPPLLKGFKGSPDEIYNANKGYEYLQHCKEFKENPENTYISELDTIHKKTDDFLQRRNDFLDHLLARFNYEVNLHPVLSDGSDVISSVELSDSIAIKESLLQHMPDLTAMRGNFNTNETGVDTSFQLFFGNMLHALSGLSYGNPVNDILGKYTILKPVAEPEDDRLFWQSTAKQVTINTAHNDFTAAMTAGMVLQNYSVEKNGNDYFILLDIGTTKVQVYSITEEESQNPSGTDLQLAGDFFSMYLQYENIFIVDHINLLPDITESKFNWRNGHATTNALPSPTNYTNLLDQIAGAIKNADATSGLEAKPDPVIGVSNDGKQFIHQDFYSARLTVIIPDNAINDPSANTANGQDTTFVNYFHTLVVNSVPAHICLELYRLNSDEYKNFLELYALFLLGQASGKEQLTAFLLKQTAYKSFLKQ